MPQIKIDSLKISDLSSKQRSLRSKTNECQESVTEVIKGLDWRVSSKSSIDTRLNKAQKRIQKQSELMGSYISALATVNEQFANKDKALKNKAKDIVYNMNSIAYLLNALGHMTDGKLDWQINLWDKLRALEPNRRIIDLFGEGCIMKTPPSGNSWTPFPLAGLLAVMNSGKLNIKSTGVLYGGIKTAASIAGKTDIKKCAAATGAKVVKTKEVKSSIWSKIKGGVKYLADKTSKVLSNPYVKSGLKIISGVTSTIALSALLVTPLAPLAVVGFVYSGNDIISGMMGLEAGKNVDLLKTSMEWTGGKVGKLIGNEELGKNIGNFVYNTGAVVTAVTSIASTGISAVNASITKEAGGMVLNVDKLVSGVAKTSWKFFDKVNTISDCIYDTLKIDLGGSPFWDVTGPFYGIYKNWSNVNKIREVVVGA